MKNQTEIMWHIEAGAVLGGVQICPVGDWPTEGRNQHCSEEALTRLVERWRADGSPEVLVDFEHRAEEKSVTSDTAAAAWASNFRVEPGRGLVADFRMTDVGAEAVGNRRLRYLSVAWDVDRKSRAPLKINSIALTNKPNIPVEPVLNKEPTGEDVKNTEPGEPAERNEKMNELKQVLGLPEDADEAAVLSAVKSLLESKAAAEREKADQEAEAFAEQNKAKCDKAVLKAQYLANKEVASALVAAIPEPAAKPEPPAQQILNKGDAKNPETTDVVAELNKLPAGKARVEFAMAHAAELAAASKI